MKKIISRFLVLVLLIAMVLPVLPTPVAIATLSRYCVLVLDVSGSEIFTSNGVRIYTADTAIDYVETLLCVFWRICSMLPETDYL